MLYALSLYLREWAGFLRVLQYPSFRIPAAALSALVLTLWLFPRFIDALRRLQDGVSNVREDTPEQHQKKSGTPSMGGVLIVLVVLAVSLVWADLGQACVWAVLVVTLGFAAIGFVDDYRKIARKNSKGMSGRGKLCAQAALLAVVTYALAASPENMIPGFGMHIDTHVALPFVPLGWLNPDLGWAYVLLAFWVIMGTSHGANLTDGLDGLAIGPTVVSAFAFLVLSYAAGLVLTVESSSGWVTFNVADYLRMPHVEGVGELAVICAAIVGAGIGFLWFNTFPASVFMGDVGSLALGGALGSIAVLSKHELVSALIHGVFLMESISVIVQVGSFKTTGRRVFRMAPIHHHFELLGWPEPKIIVRFWIMSIVCALLGLIAVKVR